MMNGLRGLPRQSALKMVVVAGAGAAFWIGIYAASLSGFRFVDKYLGSAEPLAETLLSLFFLLLGVMLLFSNAIISFGSLFRSEETSLLLTLPVEAESVFTYKLVESVTFSSWAFLVLGFPLMLGYGVSAGAPWYYAVVVLAYFAPFVLLAASVGAVVALAVAAFVPQWAKRVLGLSVVAGLVIALSVAVWAHGALWSSAPTVGEWVPRALGRMSFARSTFLPSSWMTTGLLRGARGDLGEAAYYWLLLASYAALGLLVCWELGRRLLRVGWSRHQSKAGGRTRVARGAWARVRWAPALRLLLSKDWRLFVRDPVQWSQCAILFGLMGFYVVNLRTFSYHLSRPLWRNLTALLNLTATSLVLTTVTTRFVFPMLSLEGRRFWFLGLAPVPRHVLLWSKFLFSFVSALVVTLPLVVASDCLLGLPAATVWHHGLAIAFVCFGVSGLSVGLGAVFPNWREQNPSKIVSGFGGTLNLLLCIAFVLAVVGLTALPYAVRAVPPALREATLGQGGYELLYAQLATALVAAVAGLLPMRLGLRSLERLEF
ncbi:MAG: hypothetical protein FJ290_15805 [Planctomycetes bacterium]|nr:hypothetical protein [Planctomycetota bacterium]